MTASRSRWRPWILSATAGSDIGLLLARLSGGGACGLQPAPGQPADQHRQPAAAIRGQAPPDWRQRGRGWRHGDVAAAIAPAPTGRCGPRAASRSTASALQTFRRGWMEQWIKEGKLALRWTRLSCRAFRDNAVRLQLFALAYNLANFLRSLALPNEVARWSLSTLREKLVKIGARIVRHGRYIVFQLAEVAVPRAVFAKILQRIDRLRGRPVAAA